MEGEVAIIDEQIAQRVYQLVAKEEGRGREGRRERKRIMGGRERTKKNGRRVKREQGKGRRRERLSGADLPHTEDQQAPLCCHGDPTHHHKAAQQLWHSLSHHLEEGGSDGSKRN